MGGLGGGAKAWLFRIWIKFEATWSTVTHKTAPTGGVSADLITSVTVAPSLIASLQDFRKV